MAGLTLARVVSAALIIPLTLAAETHWIRVKSDNFEMYSSGGRRAAIDTIREFEQVRGFFQQALGGPPAKPKPVRLVAFGSAKEYEAYRINDFAIAYYQPTMDRDYIVMSHAGSDTFRIAVHEYVHLLVRHAGLELPPWLNEGLAELYSTLRPYGKGKILVGDLIPGRFEALLHEKWVPLPVILAASRDSPYYNEKDKAGSLYNEGWALTHMLVLGNAYRPKSGNLLRAMSGSKDSAAVLSEIYGKGIPQIEKELRGYLQRSTFQGLLVPAKLDKISDDIPVDTLAEFDADLMLSDLIYKPGKESAYQAALQHLIEMDAKRPEPYQGLGYLAMRSGHRDEGIEDFAKAFDRGDRDPTFLQDYGRMLEGKRPEQSVPVLTALLTLDADRVDVRLELAEIQLRSGDPTAALATLAALKKITPHDSERYFRIAVGAYLRKGDRANAEATAKHFMDEAKTDSDRAYAEILLNEAKPPEAPRTETAAAAALRRASEQEQDPETGHEPPAEPRLPARPKLSSMGQFVELQCRGNQARMIVETAAGRKVFLIEDPDKVLITGQSGWRVDMTCGPQKSRAKVEVVYEAPRANQAGIDGIVRSLNFK